MERDASASLAFSRELRELREARAWTQADLAAAAGFDRTHISRLEAGLRAPTRESVASFEAALDIRDGRLHLAAGMVPEWLWWLILEDRVNLSTLSELFRRLRERLLTEEGSIHDVK